MPRVGIIRFGRMPFSGIIIDMETEMAKKKGNAGSKKSSAETRAKRSAAKVQKTPAAKDAAAVKAVLGAAAAREAEVGENEPAAEEISPPEQEAPENEAPEVDEPAPKKRRKPGRQKGDASPQAEVEPQEHIKEAMEYRLLPDERRGVCAIRDLSL
jgi:hypothetical protein